MSHSLCMVTGFGKLGKSAELERQGAPLLKRTVINKGEYMRVHMPLWISNVTGYCDGIVFMSHKKLYDVLASRRYVYPDEITEHHVSFGENAKSISITWTNASEGFKSDLEIYMVAWNRLQRVGRNPDWTIFSFPLFIKACYKAAEQSGFDLSTLTVNNFGGEEGDLLGTLSPNVGNLIITAGMPACSLDLGSLSNSIVSV